jgi:16S rRNA (adenine1518-N6/adenine1519-N6)-dimethyltransferase
MIKRSRLSGKDNVLEIGGGIGTLTKRLCDAKTSQVLTVEADHVLKKFLEDIFFDYKNLRVVGGDFLALDLAQESINKVVSNPPFHISAQIIRKISTHRLDLCIMTFQKEFIQKMVARPGTRNYSKISVVSQLAFDIESVSEVPRHCFYPSPGVDMLLVMLRPNIVPFEPPPIFWEFLNYAFMHRRRNFEKTLSQFLSSKGIDRINIDQGRANQRVFQTCPNVFFDGLKALSL